MSGQNITPTPPGLHPKSEAKTETWQIIFLCQWLLWYGTPGRKGYCNWFLVWGTAFGCITFLWDSIQGRRWGYTIRGLPTSPGASSAVAPLSLVSHCAGLCHRLAGVPGSHGHPYRGGPFLQGSALHSTPLAAFLQRNGPSPRPARLPSPRAAPRGDVGQGAPGYQRILEGILCSGGSETAAVVRLPPTNQRSDGEAQSGAGEVSPLSGWGGS